MDKMRESVEQLNKNNRSKAKESQKDASKKMDDMADSLQEEKYDAEEEDIAEDIETLRQILDNLVRVSFKQEDVMLAVKKVGAKSPLLTDYMREQNNIQDYMRMIDDSLTNLAKRQPMVEPFITKEVAKIREYSKLSRDQLVERELNKATSHQQFSLTSMNNLALMLGESLKKMKEKQNSSNCCKGKGCSKCKKGGNKSGKGKPKTARELQQQLNRQMEAMKRSMEQGEKPEGVMPANQSNMSEQFARMAAQQEREKEEKRESIEAREKYNPSPPKEWQFDKNRSQQTELLKTIPPALQYYYKEKVNRYFYNIGE
jgi:hypothetical protein